jgi:hypothetical protein
MKNEKSLPHLQKKTKNGKNAEKKNEKIKILKKRKEEN